MGGLKYILNVRCHPLRAILSTSDPNISRALFHISPTVLYSMAASVSTYINPTIDPRQLGILAIGLGGSRAHSSRDNPSDWDGIAILPTKKEICDLVSTRRDILCELLWIEIEECSSWSVRSPLLWYTQHASKLSPGN
jgi:hypothetical protein